MMYKNIKTQTGVGVEWDSAFRWQAGEENWTYKLLEKPLPLYPNRITVGMDAAKNSCLLSYGGNPGFNYLLTTFKSEHRKRGLDSFFNDLFYYQPFEDFQLQTSLE